MQRTLTSHTGAEFESGAVHRARGVNEAMPGVEVDAAGLDDDGDGWTAPPRKIAIKISMIAIQVAI